MLNLITSDVVGVSKAVPADPVLASAHTLYKCDEGAGTTLVDSAPVGKKLYGDLDLSLHGVNAWTDQPGFLSPSHTTGTWPVSSQYTDLDVLQDGGVLKQFMFTCELSLLASPTVVRENILSIGHWGEAPYLEISLNHATAGTISVDYSHVEHPPWNAFVGITAGDIRNTGRASLFVVFDYGRRFCDIYLNNVKQHFDLDSPPGNQSWTDSLSYPSSDSVFCSNNIGTSMRHIGETGGVCGFRRICSILTVADQYAQIDALAAALYRDPGYSLPPEFAGI